MHVPKQAFVMRGSERRPQEATFEKPNSGETKVNTMIAVEIGKRSEQLALQYLKQQGLRFITQNYRCYHGEIDLIMWQNQTLVFVEVRHRSNSAYGNAAESITMQKIQRLIKTAQHYLICHQRHSTQSRFDVVGIGKNHKIDWIRNAFTVECE